jgi:hypothetical protein
VACYNPDNRHQRIPAWSEDNQEGRWRSYTCEELLKRDMVNMDLFWFKDKSLEDSASLPDPDIIAAAIAEDLQAALDGFAAVAADLRGYHRSTRGPHGVSSMLWCKRSGHDYWDGMAEAGDHRGGISVWRRYHGAAEGQ